MLHCCGIVQGLQHVGSDKGFFVGSELAKVGGAMVWRG